MHALLLLIGLLLGTAAPSSLAAITTLQWIELGVTVANDAVKLPKELREFQQGAQQLRAFTESPAFRQMLAANGEAAIKWQDRQMEN